MNDSARSRRVAVSADGWGLVSQAGAVLLRETMRVTGPNTAADHIEAAGLALAQLPRQLRRKVLVRADSGGGTHEFLTWLTAKPQRLGYSVGMTITEAIGEAIGKVPAEAWTPAYDGDGQVREGAWVADITGLLDLSSWPAGMRVIVCKERPHPGAQLRFTDIDGHRFTGGSRNGCGCACSPLPDAWSTAGAACGCGSPDAGPGPARSPPQSPACKLSPPADQAEPSRRHGRKPPGPVEPRPPGATAGPPDTATDQTQATQASTSAKRKIEASGLCQICRS